MNRRGEPRDVWRNSAELARRRGTRGGAATGARPVRRYTFRSISLTATEKKLRSWERERKGAFRHAGGRITQAGARREGGGRSRGQRRAVGTRLARVASRRAGGRRAPGARRTVGLATTTLPRQRPESAASIRRRIQRILGGGAGGGAGRSGGRTGVCRVDVARLCEARTKSSEQSDPNCCPSLFDMCVFALGNHYDPFMSVRLPQNTVQKAVDAVRAAGLLKDEHVPLVYTSICRVDNLMDQLRQITSRCPTVGGGPLHVQPRALQDVQNSVGSSGLSGVIEGRLDLNKQRKITAVGFGCLGKLCLDGRAQMRVVSLDLAFCAQLDDDSLEAIALGCPDLVDVNLAGCERVGNAGLGHLSRNCRRIRVLDMQVLRLVDDRAVQDVTHDLPDLHSLNIGGCSRLTNVAFQVVASHSRALRTFSAAGCAITDFGVEDLAKCVSIECLSLRACSKITDAACRHLERLGRRKRKSRAAPLRVLDLGGCARVTDAGVRSLGVFGGLTHVDLRGLPRITKLSLYSLAVRCPELSYLNIRACKGISDTDARDFCNEYSKITVEQ